MWICTSALRQWKPDCSYPISFTQRLATSSSDCLVMLAGPRTSPASTMRFVVTSVSHATREKGSAERYVSTTASEMRSQTLSGCPSDTDSLVKRKSRKTTAILPGIQYVETAGQYWARLLREAASPPAGAVLSQALAVQSSATVASIGAGGLAEPPHMHSRPQWVLASLAARVRRRRPRARGPSRARTPFCERSNP